MSGPLQSRGRAAGLLAVAALAACATPTAPATPYLRQFGGMREVMRDGHTEARVRLADLALAPSTIAVGATTDLGGEITIADGEVHVTNAADGSPRDATGAAQQAATLLTIATPTLTVTSTCERVLDEAELERIARAANLPGVLTIDLRGRVRTVDVHVARGACPHGATTPATEPWRWSAPAGAEVRIVGFFAPGQAGVMTHHGTSFHLHALARTQGGPFTGHVDALALEPGATVVVGGAPR